uniref:DUF1559 domain-containing protein n=1 Tax=Ascaris lumbricoides TaxID=6252 RepID=A0A0M3HLN7_ASCLU
SAAASLFGESHPLAETPGRTPLPPKPSSSIIFIPPGGNAPEMWNNMLLID